MRDRLEISGLLGFMAFAVVLMMWAVIELWFRIGVLLLAVVIGITAAIATFVIDWFTGRVT